MIGVYQIELNDKYYIGSSSRNIKERCKSHLYQFRKGIHGNQYMQNAFNKYGEETLNFSILEITEIPEDVIALEQHYIDTLQPEYNILKTAGSRLGLKHSDEAKQKMSIARQNVSDETKQKMREAKLGKKHTEETRQKMSLVRQNISKKTRQKMSIAQKGRIMSDETRQKMSIAAQNMADEHKQKISLAKLGHITSDETRQKIGEGNLGKTLTEETKQKISIAVKNMSDETRRKMSIAAKLRWERVI